MGQQAGGFSNGQRSEIEGEKKEEFASVLHLLDSGFWLLDSFK
jgi:hypothetical protein